MFIVKNGGGGGAGIFAGIFIFTYVNYLSDMIQRYVVRCKGKVETARKSL